MYFIEKILKFFCKKHNRKNIYTPIDIENCEHIFLHIDSSGEYLACSKCGKIIKKQTKS